MYSWKVIKRTISAAKELGYLKNLPDLVNENNVNLIPKEKLLIIYTGTQGNPVLQCLKLLLIIMKIFL